MIAKPTSDHHFACLLLQTAPSLVIELLWSMRRGISRFGEREKYSLVNGIAYMY